MKRYRQESAEYYEVSPTEVALALGILVEEGDEVTLSWERGSVCKLTVRSVENEDVELEAPVFDPLAGVDIVIIPPPPPFEPPVTAAEIAAWARADEETEQPA